MTEEPYEYSQDDFFKWLGRCVSQWAFVEVRLFDVCVLALGVERSLASIVFFRTPSLEAKLSLVDDLLNMRFGGRNKSGQHDPPLRAEWKKLSARMRDRLAFRNYLAHQPVVLRTSLETSLPPIKPPKVQTLRYVRQNYDDRKRRPHKIDKVGVDDMIGNIEAMKIVLDDLKAFEKKLKAEWRPD